MTKLTNSELFDGYMDRCTDCQELIREGFVSLLGQINDLWTQGPEWQAQDETPDSVARKIWQETERRAKKQPA